MPPEGAGPNPPAPEFRRPLALGLVGPAGREVVIEADAAERAALAGRFGIPGIGRLRAVLRLRPEAGGPQAGGTVIARGRLEAEVTQTCVVTLEPVEQRVAEEIALRLLPPGREAQDGPEEMDEIEAAPDGTVDLGEAVAEQLSLALDPYPRAPGAVLPELGEAEGEGAAAPAPPEEKPNPFAALAALRRDR